MHVYILDQLLRRTTLVDVFDSLIWTERWRDCGDFELVVHATVENRSLFPVGTRLAINESYRVMTVETVEDKADAEGRMMLTISGRSLEATLEDRVAMDGMQGLTANPNWVITGTPGGIARDVFKQICVDGLLSLSDKIPFIQTGTLLPSGNILEPTVVITNSIDVTTVLSVVKELCDVYDMGFRLVRNFDTSQLYFEVYTGSDRTARQKVLPAVVFSPELENLKDVKKLTSVAQYKNVAYVFAKNGSLVVYGTGVDPAVSGFQRRVMVVKADDIELPAGTALTAALQRKGDEALATQQATTLLDGEISQSSGYKYGQHYNLGDLVEMRNSNGDATTMRVTEQIMTSDSQGDRSYPTLEVDLFITPGSWLAWDLNQHWSEAVGTWSEQ